MKLLKRSLLLGGLLAATVATSTETLIKREGGFVEDTVLTVLKEESSLDDDGFLGAGGLILAPNKAVEIGFFGHKGESAAGQTDVFVALEDATAFSNGEGMAESKNGVLDADRDVTFVRCDVQGSAAVQLTYASDDPKCTTECYLRVRRYPEADCGGTVGFNEILSSSDSEFSFTTYTTGVGSVCIQTVNSDQGGDAIYPIGPLHIFGLPGPDCTF